MAKRRLFTEPLTDEEHELVRQRAHKIWKARSDDGKTSAADDWAEAIEQIKRERSFLVQRAREAGIWLWQHSGLHGKTLWDLLQLLVVPLTLAIVGFGLQEFAKQRDEKIADDKARQDTLVKYLSEMSDLLQNGLLKSSATSEKVIIAQAKTVTVLQSLDAKRQHLVIQFLEAANLNALNKNGVLYKARLSKADLTGSDLSGIALLGADLSNAKLGCLHSDAANRADRECADLSVANLSGANLNSADLNGVDLNGANLDSASFIYANLNGANLDSANFNGANLSSAKLNGTILFLTDFSDADLSGASLIYADLYGAKLNGTILLKSDLSNARDLTNEQFEGSKPPYLCKTKQPSNITIDPNRDCKQMAKVLHDRYPDEFKMIEDAQHYIDTL